MITMTLDQYIILCMVVPIVLFILGYIDGKGFYPIKKGHKNDTKINIRNDNN